MSVKELVLEMKAQREVRQAVRVGSPGWRRHRPRLDHQPGAAGPGCDQAEGMSATAKIAALGA
jgi:hypothetical protein